MRVKIGDYANSKIYDIRPGSPGAERLSLRLAEGLLSLRSYERRDVNDYICGVDSILYFHCWSCQSVSSDFQGQKVNGRHYATSDGCLVKQLFA